MSSCRDPGSTDACEVLEPVDPSGQVRRSRGRQAVGSPAIIGWQSLDQSVLLEALDRAVECAWAEALAAEGLDVEKHGVTVLRPAGKADQQQQARVGSTAAISCHAALLRTA
jgi:hypothetical protein